MSGFLLQRTLLASCPDHETVSCLLLYYNWLKLFTSLQIFRDVLTQVVSDVPGCEVTVGWSLNVNLANSPRIVFGAELSWPTWQINMANKQLSRDALPMGTDESIIL